MADPEVTADTEYGLAGLKNLGNTCYANSILQALRVIPEWTNIIKSHSLDTTNNETCNKVFRAYQELAQTMWDPQTTKPSYINPGLFWTTVREGVIGTVYESFAHPIPHDAFEFITYILDQCHETMKTRIESEDPYIHSLYKSLMGYSSPVIDTMYGWDKITCTCRECGNKNIFYETFNTLKVSLNKIESKSILELMEEEYAEEIIEDYTCDACKKKTTVTFRREIWKLPKNLIFVFKRFTPDMRKNTSTFNYSGEEIQFSKFFAEDSPYDSKEFSYKPIGMINHMGTLMGGHYNAEVFHPLIKKWYIFDDESCYEREGPQFSPMTYIIVFRKT